MRKLLENEVGVGVAIIGSDEVLTALSESDTIYIDGTFRSAPRPYIQIIMIQGKISHV